MGKGDADPFRLPLSLEVNFLILVWVPGSSVLLQLRCDDVTSFSCRSDSIHPLFSSPFELRSYDIEKYLSNERG